MSRFDMVSTISSSMQRKVHHLGVLQDRSTIVPNWVDTSKLHPGAQGKDLREEWGLSSVQPVVLYAGNMGKKQGLEIVLDVAEKMLVNNPAVRFVLVGEGAAKADLVAGAEKRKLTNILFRPLQPLENLPGLLTMADIHLVIQKRGVADAVMPSKLTGILASGGFSIITADQDTELGRLVDEHPGIAVRAEPEDADALAAAVQRILETVRGTGRINQVARKYAERTLDQQVILSELERRLIRLSGASAPLPS